MRILLDWIKTHSHWLILFILEGISLSLVMSFNKYQASIWFTGANAVAGTIIETEDRLLAYIRLGRENSELVSRNIYLQRQLELLRSQVAQLQHDSTYTERQLAKHLANSQTVPAHVASNTVMLKDNYLVIDRGRADGITPECGVVSGTGIVGIVSKVSDHRALVMSVLNSRSSISCRLRGSEYFGYLRWYGGSTLCATLDDVPRHARFKIGDAVETSGFSNVFPAGIYVGKVIKVRDSQDGLSYQLVVQLSTDLASLRNVAVIINQNDTTDFKIE